MLGLLGWMLPAACDEKVELPPEDAPRVGDVEPLDVKHAAVLQGDRQITVPNMVFVIQPGLEPGELAITLTSRRPGQDGSRLVFGTFEKAGKAEELLNKDLTLAGGPFLDPAGAGVFTPLSSYQPKLAALRLLKLDAGEAEGKISGEFYRFNPTRPKIKPDVIEFKGKFTAVLIQK